MMYYIHIYTILLYIKYKKKNFMYTVYFTGYNILPTLDEKNSIDSCCKPHWQPCEGNLIPTKMCVLNV